MLRNIFSNWALIAIQIGVLLYQTPIQIRALGLSGQDVWLTVASLTGYLALLTMGVPMASVRFIAAHATRREIDETNAAIATCLGVSLVLAAAAMGVSAGLWLFFDHTYLRGAAWADLAPWLRRDGRIAFWLASLQVSLGFVAQLPYGIFDAHHAFPTRNAVKTAGIVTRLALIVGVLRFHPSLILLAGIQLGAMVLELTIALVLIRRRWPHLRLGLRGMDRARVKEILSFSVFAMLLSLGSQLSFQSDQLVINAFGTPEQGTLFDVGNKFFPPLVQLVIGIGAVMMPTATALQAKGRLDELRPVFLKWSKIAYSMALLVGVYLVVLGPEFLGWWMGPSFAVPSGRVTRVIMISFLFFLPARGVASPTLMGLGKPALVSLAFLGMGAANLGLSLWLVHPLGIYGVAAGTAVPCVLFAGAVAWLACREVGVPVREYLGYVMLRPSLGVIPPLFVLYFVKRGMNVFDVLAPRWVAFVPLLLSGLAMVGVFLVVWLLYVYHDDPYVDVGAGIDRVLPPRLRRTQGGRVAVGLGGLVLAVGPGLLALALRDDPRLGFSLSVAAAAGALMIVLAEIVARAVIRRRAAYYRYTPHAREEHRFDRTLLPAMPAVSRVEINADGERGDPAPRAGDAAFRALVVGASAAECYYLDQDGTWSAVVQRALSSPEALRALGAPRVHVGNVGRALVPAAETAVLLRRILPRYRKVDAVLVMVGASDVLTWVQRGMPPEIPRADAKPDRLFEVHPETPFGWRPRRTALWRLLSHLDLRLRRPVIVDADAGGWLRDVRRMRAEATRWIDETPDPSPMLARFEEGLRALIRAAQEKGAQVIVVRQPWFGGSPGPEEEAMFWNFGVGRPYKERVTSYLTPRAFDALLRAVDRRAAAVAEAMGVDHVDLMAVLEPSGRTFYDELHFTPEGAEIVGRSVAAAVLSSRVIAGRGADVDGPRARGLPSDPPSSFVDLSPVA